MHVVNSWVCSVVPPCRAQSLWELLELDGCEINDRGMWRNCRTNRDHSGFNVGAIARLDWFTGERLVVIKLYTNAVVAYSLLGSI